MTVVMEMGRLMGVLLGLLQVCVQFKVPSYRDYRSAVSACVLRVENEYLFCNFFPLHTTYCQANASILLFSGTNKKRQMPSCHISGLFAFIRITLQVTYQVLDIGT